MKSVKSITKRIAREAKRIFINECAVYVNYPEKRMAFEMPTEIHTAKSENDLCALCRPEKPLLEAFHMRFQNKEECFFMAKDNELIAYGWMSRNREKIFIWEIAANIHLSTDANILYDFWVHPSFRQKGIYSKMLKCILSYIGFDGKAIIYAMKENVYSRCAIEKSGFEKIDNVSFFRRRVIT